MALIDIAKELFPPTATEFNTVNVSVKYDDVNNEIVIYNNVTAAVTARVGQAKPTSIVAAANAATLATAPYIAMGIGTMKTIVNYNATAKGCTIQKLATAAGTAADWKVIATDDKADTGAIGVTPI